MNDRLMTINGVRGRPDANGTAELNLEDAARELGFTQRKGGSGRLRSPVPRSRQRAAALFPSTTGPSRSGANPAGPPKNQAVECEYYPGMKVV